MNYFEFFKIEPSFFLNEGELRKLFLQNSKRYHPDFYTLKSEEKQAEILEFSTLNNQAYKTLKDFDKRLHYILDLNDVLEEEGKNTVPQDFLMEMMEVNEQLMELEFDFNVETKKSLTQQIESISQQIYQEVEPHLKAYPTEKGNPLSQIKDYYFKKKYLLRIEENLAKFQSE